MFISLPCSDPICTHSYLLPRTLLLRQAWSSPFEPWDLHYWPTESFFSSHSKPPDHMNKPSCLTTPEGAILPGDIQVLKKPCQTLREESISPNLLDGERLLQTSALRYNRDRWLQLTDLKILQAVYIYHTEMVCSSPHVVNAPSSQM